MCKKCSCFLFCCCRPTVNWDLVKSELDAIRSLVNDPATTFSYDEKDKRLITDPQKQGHYTCVAIPYKKCFFLTYTKYSDDIFTDIGTVKEKRAAYKKQKEPNGWKLHFSFANSEEAIKGWRIIQAVIMYYQLDYAKVFMPKFIEKLTNKQITLYEHKNPNISEKSWQKILMEIEYLLLENNIQPGDTPKADKMIDRSQFITYRNDEIPANNGYLNAEQAIAAAQTNGTSAHNPFNQEDIFKDITILPASKALLKGNANLLLEVDGPRLV